LPAANRPIEAAKAHCRQKKRFSTFERGLPSKASVDCVKLKIIICPPLYGIFIHSTSRTAVVQNGRNAVEKGGGGGVEGFVGVFCVPREKAEQFENIGKADSPPNVKEAPRWFSLGFKKQKLMVFSNREPLKLRCQKGHLHASRDILNEKDS